MSKTTNRMKTIKLQLLIWLIPIGISLYCENIQSMNKLAPQLILLLSSDPITYIQVKNTVTAGNAVYLWIKNTDGTTLNLLDCELTSSKPAVATVDSDGTVVAVTPGIASIKAVTNDYKEGTLTITVLGDDYLILNFSSSSTQNNPIDKTVEKGKTIYLYIQDTKGNVINLQDCELTSSNTNIATIAEDGTVTAVASGTTTIKAVRKSDKVQGTLTFTVIDPTDVITPPADAIKVSSTDTGLSAQFDSEAAIELYTVSGILIDKAKASQSYSRDLDKGVYIIRINGKTVKFVR